MSDLLVRSFGSAVRSLRESRGWSQEQLAEHADLNRSYVGEVERGRAIASLVTIDKLSQALGVSSATLLGHCDELSSASALKGLPLAAIAC
ncbi:helix-turn-helix domain-containing protein [Acidovorax sp. LjRoot129]|uniref:helix-turn-helix domain-containing protein n=1 Tax=Acidovorax sp. LjRoot129 TaxID=3342260 RepID=UPI00120D34D9|nr:MAG: XRE family transcriptional regulator [Acidovorax sp.]